jgi:signal transduction histidine kinase
MGTLLDLLFDVSRVRSGKLTLEAEELDLVDVVHRAADTVQAVVGSPPISVSAPRGRIPVLGDPTRLEQVFVNVIGNAVEHAGTPRVEVALKRQRETVRAQIRDFGSGIDPTSLPDLFEPYRPLQSGDAPASAGLGLGLFLSREIVVAHGGEIKVASALGSGTVVTIALPLVTGPAGAGAGAASSARRRP